MENSGKQFPIRRWSRRGPAVAAILALVLQIFLPLLPVPAAAAMPGGAKSVAEHSLPGWVAQHLCKAPFDPSGAALPRSTLPRPQHSACLLCCAMHAHPSFVLPVETVVFEPALPAAHRPISPKTPTLIVGRDTARPRAPPVLLRLV